jgi:hypothetical protein
MLAIGAARPDSGDSDASPQTAAAGSHAEMGERACSLLREDARQQISLGPLPEWGVALRQE